MPEITTLQFDKESSESRKNEMELGVLNSEESNYSDCSVTTQLYSEEKHASMPMESYLIKNNNFERKTEDVCYYQSNYVQSVNHFAPLQNYRVPDIHNQNVLLASLFNKSFNFFANPQQKEIDSLVNQYNLSVYEREAQFEKSFGKKFTNV